ncbi:MAG: hypothetical protein IPM96_08265 [Ignavibacteria bacterium]|nr:hypothetical protein [Ignavibacteria bacterium]
MCAETKLSLLTLDHEKYSDPAKYLKIQLINKEEIIKFNSPGKILKINK